jgi:accessory colonization factor AcfC
VIKKGFLPILIGAIIIWGFGFESDLSAQDKPLRIYGPEGPFAPMKDCAEIFSRIHGVKADVFTGPGSSWITKAKEDADVVYEETEHNLTHFMNRHP